MVEIKQKNLDRREWYTDTDRDFVCKYHKDDFFEGGIGLITFTGIKAPDEVDKADGNKLIISDKGYQWVELAPGDKNYVITSMFRGDEIFQHYVDITLKNEVAENGDAVFYDLLLDVVIDGNGTISVIDTEELDEALETGVISKEQYDLARSTAEDVVELFKHDQKLVEQKLALYKEMLEN
ncbi:DUF402 domain-containing protein [Butyrivibrio sp. VCB2006]|uniref:DUF402 domain-containing protein n=1 Tax=Butyrivibrio sp. VCB2006 TaxID=1280679 RepID=UPI000420D063|nr:DUF402 domain-containing protein [Butyrivibrio sp. VCB2006]